MSGICGVWRKQHPELTAKTLASICGGLSLDSGDRAAQETEMCAGVGVSARFATQQVYQDPRVMIACDADLMNADELGEIVGEQLTRSAKTTALLAALYERFGCDFVEKLRGAFSVILWDRRERKMLAAVDSFGINRLVYYQDGDVLLIGSRIDALMRSADINREINPRAIANILNFSCNLAPETIFTKVQRLLPGTLLLASGGHTKVQKYWDMRYGVQGDSSEAHLSRELESVVEESVASHCKSGSFAQVGAFLSGGTDSSTVVGMMARTKRGPVRTFSIGFQEQQFNELGYARITANAFDAEHHTYLVGPRDCFEALPHIVRSFDEPFGNSSAIPTYFCARLAAQNGVKVLLAGDGGDELFGGNEHYRTDKIFELYQSVPLVLRKALIERVLAGLPVQNGLVGKARSYVRRSNTPSVQRMLSYHFLCAHSPVDIFAQDFLKALAGYSVLEIPSRYYADAPASDHLDRLLYLDVKITLGDSDLPKVTRMTEIAGVQARFPFLARAVAEFSGCIPARLKVKGLEKRYLFKRAFRNLLPVDVINKKKHGFGIPVSTWLKSDPRLREFSRDTLLSTHAFERGYFRREFIEDLFSKHEADDSSYYGDTLWTFLVLELWHRQYVDAPIEAAV